MAESYVFCGLQKRGTEMLRLPGEDAIISWPNAKSTVIDQRDAYMARTIWAAATGTFLFQSALGLNPTVAPSPSPSLDVNQSEFEAKPRISSWGLGTGKAGTLQSLDSTPKKILLPQHALSGAVMSA